MKIKKNKYIPLDKFVYKSLYDKNIGYYMKNNPFGKDGDFITAPNISVLFSEMLAIWCIAFWENLGCPKKINLIELGGGNGEMMYQMIKVFERFNKFKVVKMKTEELINNSFLVVFFDSSAILQAIKLKKKIIAIRSNLFFGGKKYNSDLYAERIGLKKIDITKKLNINKNKLLEELSKNVKNYDNYLNKYSSANISESGSIEILNYIPRHSILKPIQSYNNIFQVCYIFRNLILNKD